MEDLVYVYIFHFLWNIQFWAYFTYAVVAGSIADWYFSAWDSSGDYKRRGEGFQELSDSPVTESCGRNCRFHLGSIAFGSLIIAIIQFIRGVVRYMEKHCQAETPNALQKTVLACLACFLKCAEACMDKLNKHAFVWVSIYGDSFIPSCCSSFQLIWANLLRMVIVDVVGDYLLLVGRFMIAMATTGICSIIIDHTFKDEINSSAIPLTVIFVFSFTIATLFMIVFETAVDTVFLCFLIDESNPRGEMLAAPSLKKLMTGFDSGRPDVTQAQYTKL
jgi:hypothetical protein